MLSYCQFIEPHELDGFISKNKQVFSNETIEKLENIRDGYVVDNGRAIPHGMKVVGVLAASVAELSCTIILVLYRDIEGKLNAEFVQYANIVPF